MSRKVSVADSINNALSGIVYFFQLERNSRIHFIAAVLATSMGIILKISLLEWALIFISIALVWGSELLNTAIEKICDYIHPDFDNKIKLIKDLAAGSVLVFSLISIIIGFIVFLPPLHKIIILTFFYK